MHVVYLKSYFIVQKIRFHFIIVVLIFSSAGGIFILVYILFHSLCNVSALQKPDPNGYMDVECCPIISIPAPHDEVQYSEVRTFLLLYYNLPATTSKEAKCMQVDTT